MQITLPNRPERKSSKTTREGALSAMNKHSGQVVVLSLKAAAPQDLTSSDWENLNSTLSKFGKNLSQFMMEVDQGVHTLYWLDGDETRVLLALQFNTADDELFIYAISGYGWIYHLEQAWEQLLQLAKDRGLKYVAGWARSPGLRRAYEAAGAKQFAVHYRREV